MTEQDYGTKIDEMTVRFERIYPHPVERVFTALTTGSSVDAWMMPTNTIDAKLGGEFFMSFSQPEGKGFHGTIGEFEPNRVVRYDFDNNEVMRFTVESVDGGTKVVFVHTVSQEALDEMAPPDGSDEPWEPHMLAGWHSCMDALNGFLDGDPSVTAQAAHEESQRAMTGEFSPRMQELIEHYTASVNA